MTFGPGFLLATCLAVIAIAIAICDIFDAIDNRKSEAAIAELQQRVRKLEIDNSNLQPLHDEVCRLKR